MPTNALKNLFFDNHWHSSQRIFYFSWDCMFDIKLKRKNSTCEVMTKSESWWGKLREKMALLKTAKLW